MKNKNFCAIMYSTIDVWKIEHQNNNGRKEAKTRTKRTKHENENSRREGSAYELRLDDKRRESIFPLRFLLITEIIPMAMSVN